MTDLSPMFLHFVGPDKRESPRGLAERYTFTMSPPQLAPENRPSSAFLGRLKLQSHGLSISGFAASLQPSLRQDPPQPLSAETYQLYVTSTFSFLHRPGQPLFSSAPRPRGRSLFFGRVTSQNSGAWIGLILAAGGRSLAVRFGS